MRRGGTESAVVEGSLAVALTAAAVLHIAGAGPVDPLRTVISDYVVVPGGYALLALAAAALATASVAAAVGLCRSGLPRPRLPAALLASGAVAVFVAGLVPTNLPGHPVGLGAQIHRVGGGWTFVALPLAGWLIARRAFATTGAWRAAAPGLRTGAAVAATVTAAFLLVQIGIVIPGSPTFPYIGGMERVVCATVMVVLLTIAWTMRATAMSSAAAVTPAAPATVPDDVPVALDVLGRAA
ncbi:MAG: DUF998 domain-containing protein [Pseudonocardia sp.]|nr:DUF998 domain-containing protein [Pseudonocardia sp.]